MPIGLALIELELVLVLTLIAELVFVLTLIADKLYLDRYRLEIPLWSRAYTAKVVETPPSSQLEIIMQRLEQMEQGKRALEVIVGTVQRDVEEVKTKKGKESYLQTWEANAKTENPTWLYQHRVSGSLSRSN